MNINKTLSFLNRLDWFVAGVTLAVGFYLQNYWVIGSGALGMVAAWYRPADRIKAALEKKFFRKKAGVSDAQKAQAEDAFYADVLGKPAAQPDIPQPSSLPSRGDFTEALTAGQFRLNLGRHSVVRYEHLNLAPASAHRTWA